MASFLSTLFGGGAEREAADQNRALYAQYGQQGTTELNSALTNSTGALNNARGDYGSLSDLAGQYRQGAGLYSDALGVNGAAGNARATSAFTTAPGYQQGIDAGIDVLNRRRAAAGMVNSGNADLDALTYGQNSQNQQYSNWLTNLSGLNNNALTATGAVAQGQAGVDTNLANLYQTDATNRIGLQGNVTSGNAAANNFQAQGAANGAGNVLRAGLGLASLATGGIGGAGGSFLSSLGGAGGGNNALANRQSTLGYNPLGGAFNFGG